MSLDGSDESDWLQASEAFKQLLGKDQGLFCATAVADLMKSVREVVACCSDFALMKDDVEVAAAVLKSSASADKHLAEAVVLAAQKKLGITPVGYLTKEAVAELVRTAMRDLRNGTFLRPQH